MSEERFDQIDLRLDRSEERFDQIDLRLDRSEERFDQIDLRLDRSEERFDRIDLRFAGIETKLDALAQGGDELGRQMHALNDQTRQEMRVLHEDLVDKIKALAPDFGPIRREFSKADAKLRDDIDQRLTPIEAALRKRS